MLLTALLVGGAMLALHSPVATLNALILPGTHTLLADVRYGPGPRQIRKLPPLHGDSVGMAFWINDHGQAVGASGRCANTILPGFAGFAKLRIVVASSVFVHPY